MSSFASPQPAAVSPAIPTVKEASAAIAPTLDPGMFFDTNYINPIVIAIWTFITFNISHSGRAVGPSLAAGVTTAVSAQLFPSFNNAATMAAYMGMSADPALPDLMHVGLMAFTGCIVCVCRF